MNRRMGKDARAGWRGGLERLEPRLVLDATVIISEFMADNNNTLVDFEGDSSDWIELLNIGAALDPAIGLQGWFLTDDADNLTKWEVPVVTPLGTNQQVLIYASGKNLVSPAGELHANFQIDSGGEYLALVKPDGVTIAAEFANVPNQREDVSYGLSDAGRRYFTTPTPGGPNNAGTLGFVADTTFSVDRGFYEEPIQVEISTDTDAAELRYTLDGTWPGEGVGRRYTGAITIDSTTTLRAVAVKPGFISSNVDTQTYLFLDDVIDQSTAPKVGPSDDRISFPNSWGGTAADYQMDPEVTGDPLYADQMRDALLAIPTLSLTLAQADIFGSGGLYSNPGDSAEQRTSAELFFPDGRNGFQIDAGLRMQGGASRSTPFKKHSLSLRFRDVYGDGRLDYPLFEDSPVDSFDSLHLRAMYNNSWIKDGQDARNRGSLIRDQWMRDALLAMGQQDAGQGTYVHLYLNGLYWGVYNLHERPRAAHYAEYNGGADAEEDDYDALNSGQAEDGNTSSWNSLLKLISNLGSGGISLAEYQQIAERLDLANFADYMIVNHYGGNGDWDNHNWRSVGGGPAGGQWRIYGWDGERVLEDVSSNRTARVIGPITSMFLTLRIRSAEFRLLFADRLHQHLFNDGALTSQGAADLWMARADELDVAIIGESARWGDFKQSQPLTRNGEWIPEQNRLMNTYFPFRTRNVLDQYRSLGGTNTRMYPAVDAPEFIVNVARQHGGSIDVGAAVTFCTENSTGTCSTFTAAGSRTLYYTLDGSDPRLVGGNVNPDAMVYASEEISLLESTQIKARIRASGGVWSALSDATFIVPGLPALRLTEINYNPSDLGGGDLGNGGALDNDEYEFLELQNVGRIPLDLSGTRFTEGVKFDFSGSKVTSLDPGQYVLVVRNEAAFRVRYPLATDLVAGQFVDSELSGKGEQLAMVDALGQTVFNFEYDDNWYDITDGDGFSLTVRNARTDPAALGEKSSWQPSATEEGTPGRGDPGPVLGSVVINEVLTHADDSVTGDWIELLNTTDEEIAISGWYLSDSGDNLRKFRIPDDTMLPAGSFLTFDQLTFDQFGTVGFGDHSLSINPLGNPGAFGLSELGSDLRLSSVDPTRVRENIDAVHVLDNGHIILSTATSAVLGTSALSFRNGDLVEYDPATDTASLIFSESVFVDVATGLLRSGENVDAFSRLSGGDLVISTAEPARIGDLVFGDGDLVSYNPTTGVATLLLSEELFTGGSDIDAVHVVEVGGQITRLILSTDGPGTISGVLYDDGDLIEIIPGTGADLATAQLGVGGEVRRYLAESVFAVGNDSSGDPTENIDAVFIDPDENIMLSMSSSAAFDGLGEVFQNGDLVQLSAGRNAFDLMFEEDPAAGRTFYGEAAGYREKVDFGAADPEVTFGLFTKSDGTSDFVAQVTPTKGEPNGVPRIGPVVINELMYNPDVGVEFIELKNISGAAVSLADPPNPDPLAVVPAWKFTNGVTFSFPAGATLPAGGFALVLPQPTSGFANFEAFAADFRSTNAVPASAVIYGPYVGSLRNGGEAVELSRPGKVEFDGTLPDVQIDRVRYDNKSPWPTEPHGGGPSLSRFDSADYGNDVVNWLPSGPAGSNSGTPGRTNTTFDVSPPSAPTDIRTSVISDVRIDVSWQPSTDLHSGIFAYNVYRNGVLIGPQVSSTSFPDTDIVGSTVYTYQIAAINGNQIEGPLSLPAVAAVLTITSTEVSSVTEVRIGFSEKLDGASAEVLSNYQLAGPRNPAVLSARLDSQDPSGSTVILTTTSLEEQETYQLTVNGVVALGGNTMSQTPQVIVLVVPDHTAPRITQVQIAGSAWSADFLAHLAVGGALSIPGGPQQLTTIPWSGVDRIIVHFSENVDVVSGDLRVFGVNVPAYEFADFQYNATSFIATWTLASSPRADKLLVDLSDRVHDNSDNPIDGNWQDGTSTFPSGNGVTESNDDFRFQINVLPGNATAGDLVDRGDLVDVIHALGSSTVRGPYDPRQDLNTDGQVDIADLRVALLSHGSALPTSQPTIRDSAPVNVIAIDEVFDRLGGAPVAQAALTSESTRRTPDELPLVNSSDPPLSRRSAARRRGPTSPDLNMAIFTPHRTLRQRPANARRTSDDSD